MCVAASCGDMILHEGVEQCEDGNDIDTDDCIDCSLAVCGDSFLHEGFEECDDANGVDTDACTNACNDAACGDGILYEGVEPCDDGNMINTDNCVANCLLPTCGDGFVHQGVEPCDDGNLNNNDMCTTACEPPVCGDGFVQGNEQCDDGNNVANDDCANNCTWARRYVFATTTTYTGNLGGIAGADQRCNQRAQAANLPGTYMAWISVVGTSPSTRFTQSAVPYVLVNGTVVADNWADLVNGSLDNAIARTEMNTVTPDTAGACEGSVRLVRTGTNSNGTQGPNICNNFTSSANASLGTAGRTTSVTATWSNCAPMACDMLLPIYCFQQ
jgi:cysteine-rich repeat protein